MPSQSVTTARRRRAGRASAATARAGAAGPVDYLMSCPARGVPGKATAVTFTPQAPASDSLTLSGGTWTPASLSWSASAAPQVAHVTYATAGTYHPAASSTAGGAVFGSPATIVIAAPHRRPRWCPPRRRR